ncbi:MAG: hypothetical protein ROR55_01015 [Devosia sp.]
MFTVGEIKRSLWGAWQLFLGRPEGLAALDRSLSGFWRSFGVIIFLLPINAVATLAITRAGATDGETFNELFFDGLPVLMVDWVAFPLLLAAAAGPLGIKGNYVSYVVARNWAAPIAAAILMVPFLLQGAGWIDVNMGVILSVVGLGIVLRFHYMIVRISLGLTVPLTIGLVVADLLLTLVLVGLLG